MHHLPHNKFAAVGFIMFGLGGLMMVITENEKISNFFKFIFVIGTMLILLAFAMMMWET